ncbi:hypothetical protein DFQ26_004692 [Actinomortierella ambigua]|nr:hypothetical protein DFQ26_004692 [Actinomortierella ambigua]
MPHRPRNIPFKRRRLPIDGDYDRRPTTPSVGLTLKVIDTYPQRGQSSRTNDKRKSSSSHSMSDHGQFGSLQQLQLMQQMQQMQMQARIAQPMAATIAPEILSWTFRHLMDRKSLLNCSLVCRSWHGPARGELVHFLRDMPYNGQGLVQAIRTRFTSETITSLSVFAFDKLLWNLAEVYYHSNPETKAIFAPQYPPDMLYHLFWTFLFVDQEFRNPRTKSKVNSGYYIRLLQGEGCTYPKPHFHKKVFKNIFNNIRAKPLLPTPHLIQTLQVLGEGHGGGAAALNSLFMRFSGSLRIEDSLRKVRQWWRNMREIGAQISSTSMPPSTSSSLDVGGGGGGGGGSTATMASSTGTLFDTKDSSRTFDVDTPLFESNDFSQMPVFTSYHPQQQQHHETGSRSTLSSPALHRYSLFGGSASGSRSDACLHQHHSHYHNTYLYQHPPFMNLGFTSVRFGWHPEGDGLDNVVRLPFSEEPSRLGDQHRVLQASSIVTETGVVGGDEEEEDGGEEENPAVHIEVEQ